jgi:hypothetical protein
MIKLRRNEPNKSIIAEMTLAGETFKIELIPFSEQEQIKLFKPFRKTKNVVNPLTKRMEIIPYLDNSNVDYMKMSEDLLDKIVVNFWGIGGADGELDGSVRENKILLGSVQVDDVEDITVVDQDTGEKAIIKQPRTRKFSALIFDKASKLAGTIVEVETGNL